jgi:hypothetical protein
MASAPEVNHRAASDGEKDKSLPVAGLLWPAVDPPRWHPIEAEHWRAVIRLVIALEVLGAGIEGHQLLEQPVISRQLNHGSAGRVSADHVAGLGKVAQQRASLSGRGITDTVESS